MKISILFVSLIITLLFGEEIRVKEANIVFNLSESWDSKANILNQIQPIMSPEDPLYLAWKRKVIIDKNGNPISAGLNVTVFNVQADTNIVLISYATSELAI